MQPSVLPLSDTSAQKCCFKTLLKPGIVAHTCYPTYTEVIHRRIVVQAGLGKNERPYCKK
jgi:hypothetical protein